MKFSSLKMSRGAGLKLLLSATITSLIISSCTKNETVHNQSNQVSTFSTEVLDKWISMQLRLMKNATGIPNQAFSRHYAYAGITALESVAPGLPGHAAWSTRWNGLSGLPSFTPSVHYYYPANINAALATINRKMFPNANAADKLAIDSLETAFNSEFVGDAPADLINVSSQFGKDVATAVYNWSETDGYKVAGNAYTPPTGAGLWVPTPAAYAPASTPYWGNNRTVITGSTQNTSIPAPVAYSTTPGSAFHNMVKEVYDVSVALTNEQKAMAAFWRDVPGATSPGHWLSITQQLIRQENAKLDKALFAYALSGAAVNDALISCFKMKYHHNLVRPITYIRDVMGHTTWNSFLGTPPHPEYSSAHAALSAAAAGALQNIFGEVGSFTDHTYDYMNMPARTYSSITAIGEEAGRSRLYAGIHYTASIDAGLWQGRKVVSNIFFNQSSQAARP